MPTYKITNPNTGKTVRVTGDAPPTQADAAFIFASIDPTPQVQPAGEMVTGSFPEVPLGNFEGTAEEFQRQLDTPIPEQTQQAAPSLIDRARGVGEVALQGLSSLPATITFPVGTAAAIAENVASGDFGTRQGAQRAQERAMELTDTLNPFPVYEPQTREGQRYSQAVEQALGSLPPVAATAGQQIISAASRLPSATRENVVDTAKDVVDTAKDVVETVIPERMQRMSARQMAALRRKISGIDDRVKVFEQDGTITPEAIEVLSRQQEADSRRADVPSEDIEFTPKRLETYNAFLRQGIQPTRANITGSTNEQSMQQQAKKQDGIIRDVIAQQNSDIAKKIDEQFDLASDVELNRIPDDFVIDGTDISTGSNIFKAADNFAEKSENAIDDAYRVARENANKNPVVDPRPLFNSVMATLGADRANRGVPSAVQNELLQMGVVTKNKQGKLNVNRQITVEEAESIRQYLNSFFKDKPEARPTIRRFKDALDSAVESATGGDVFIEARRLKTEYQKAIDKAQIEYDPKTGEAKRVKRGARDKSRKNLVTDIIEGRIDEDKIFNRVDSAGSNDFRNFYSFMTEFAGDEGKAALQSLKARYWKKMLDTIKLEGSRTGGVPDVSYGKLKGFVNKLIQNGKFPLIFNKAERALIEDLLQITNSMVMDRSVQSGDGPSGAAIAKLGDRLLQSFAASNMVPIPDNYLTKQLSKNEQKKIEKRLLNVPSELSDLVERSFPDSLP